MELFGLQNDNKMLTKQYLPKSCTYMYCTNEGVICSQSCMSCFTSNFPKDVFAHLSVLHHCSVMYIVNNYIDSEVEFKNCKSLLQYNCKSQFLVLHNLFSHHVHTGVMSRPLSFVEQQYIFCYPCCAFHCIFKISL